MLAPLMKPKHFEETFLAMDASHDHKIDFEEFKKFSKSVLRPHAKLYVHLVRGNGLRKADGLFGKSDPYVKIFFRTNNGVGGDKQIGTSTVCRKTLDPTYNQVFCGQFDLSDISWEDMSLRLEVYDEDKRGSDDFLGQVEFCGTSLHNVLGKSNAENFKLEERKNSHKKDKKPTGTLQLRCSLGELAPFKIDLSSNITAKPIVKEVEKSATSSPSNKNTAEVLALQTTIKRLTKQLARVKKREKLGSRFAGSSGQRT